MTGILSQRLFLILAAGGLTTFATGAGMRVYAAITLVSTEQRLLAARPPSGVSVPTPARDDNAASKDSSIAFEPSDGPPVSVRLPELGLWNDLQPVTAQVSWHNGQIDAAWDVADAGWHVPSGWPGYGRNVVMAGHSPSRDPGVWSRSIFRQLAYLNPGDRIEVLAGHYTYVYQVARVFAVPASEADNDAEWIDPAAPTGESLTLITCWPPHTASYRVLVIARPVKSLEGSS